MFDLMNLPVELRIKVYEHALVRDVLRIVSIIHPFAAIRPWKFEDRQVLYEEPNRKKSVVLRSRKTFMKNVKYIAGSVVGDEVYWSYGLQPCHDPPLVNIFLTSRKVYFEAWPIFYQKNAFAFTIPNFTRDSAENCLRFLYDRPYHALRHIRELHLLISAKAPYHPLGHQFYDHSLQLLLDELSRYMSLRVFVLYLRGCVDATDDYSLQRLPVPWKESLGKVTGLQELHMDIVNTSTDEENIAFVKDMRSKMVVGGEHMGTEDFILGQLKDPSFFWLHSSRANSLLTTTKYTDMEENHGYYDDFRYAQSHSRQSATHVLEALRGS